MFDRNVKLQFNKMKYADLVQKTHAHTNITFHHGGVMRTRLIYFYLGMCVAYSLLNYDVWQYKASRGLARWKGRLSHTFPFTLFKSGHGHDSHGHGHENEHKESHDSHATPTEKH